MNYPILKKRKQHGFLSQIQSYILQKSEQHYQKHKDFKQILETKNCGLLVTERFINLPSEIIPHLHSEMQDDLQFTKQQDDIEDKREFDY